MPEQKYPLNQEQKKTKTISEVDYNDRTRSAKGKKIIG